MNTTWLDGEIVNADSTALSVRTHSLSYATSIFEGMRAYSGRIFRCAEHLDRLRNSARIMGHTISWSDAELTAVCAELAEAEPDGYVKVIVFFDDADISYMARGCASRIVAFTVPFPAMARREELRLTTAAWRRPPADCHPYQAKTSATYALAYLSYRAAGADFDDVLFLSTTDTVCESSGSNVFFVRGSHLVTPTTELALAGITRHTVIEDLAPMLGLSVEQRNIRSDELADFDAAFLCGTAMEIAGVSRIDELRYTRSEMVAALANEYQKLVTA